MMLCVNSFVARCNPVALHPGFDLSDLLREALNNSSMNDQSMKKISAILSFSSFSMA